MLHALPPEPVPQPATVEVSGPTLEGALARAYQTYGGDVHVLSAVRVRRGLRGFLGSSQVRVTVVPPVVASERVQPQDGQDGQDAQDAQEPQDAQGGDLDVVFAALLDDADDGDEAAPVRTPTGRADTAELPALPVGQEEAAESSLRSALAALGVPARILGRLPVEEPDDPVHALARAIEMAVGKPVRPGPDQPVALDGYGADGAVAMLQAAVVGVPPGRLIVEGSPARPATPKRLAEVICACVS